MKHSPKIGCYSSSLFYVESYFPSCSSCFFLQCAMRYNSSKCKNGFYNCCVIYFVKLLFLFLIKNINSYDVPFVPTFCLSLSSFLMNTDKDCHGVPMNKNVIITVFHRSHLYYGAGKLSEATMSEWVSYVFPDTNTLCHCAMLVYSARNTIVLLLSAFICMGVIKLAASGGVSHLCAGDERLW